LAAETTAASALPEAVSATPVVAIVPGQAPLNGTQAPSRPAADPASPDAQIALTEKFAASARAIYPVAPLPGLPEKKDFLNAGQLSVNTPASSVGIGVAQVSVVMPPTSFNRLKTLPAVEAMTNVSVSVNAPTVLSLVPDAPAPPASLRETMAAVVTAVEALERRSDAVQKSVDLHFDVGAERLALRVELRDGTVHTTFRTESPELRAALAHEWQAAMPSTAGRELRLADPVFSSATTSGGEAASGSLGQGAPHQRGQQTPEPAPFARMSEFSDSPVADFAPATPVAPNSATLLQAFA
jgi:hypothetical protein